MKYIISYLFTTSAGTLGTYTTGTFETMLGAEMIADHIRTVKGVIKNSVKIYER